MSAKRTRSAAQLSLGIVEATVLVVTEMIPESVLNEDGQLQMIYDTAVTQSGDESN
jgi:hypothetical protein